MPTEDLGAQLGCCGHKCPRASGAGVQLWCQGDPASGHEGCLLLKENRLPPALPNSVASTPGKELPTIIHSAGVLRGLACAQAQE